MRSEPATSLAVGIPARIGPYRPSRTLGRGATGQVVLATDERLRRPVAIKLLRRDASPRTVKRFLREGRLLASLRHPGVVAVHDVDLCEGRAYLVMDLLGGQTLREVIEGVGQLDWRDAVRIVQVLARTLSYVHQQGVVHRDLKPENVILDERGRPVLTDFGLGKASDATQVTEEGGSLGTPAFWAPEQARGRLDQIGPATDVYGLGGILYALLTGRAPNQGETLMQLIENLDELPPRPSESSEQEPPPDALDELCLRCLAPDPSERPQSAAELALALGEILEGKRRERKRTAVVSWLALAALGLSVVVLLGEVLRLRLSESSAGPTPALASVRAGPGDGAYLASEAATEAQGPTTTPVAQALVLPLGESRYELRSQATFSTRRYEAPPSEVEAYTRVIVAWEVSEEPGGYRVQGTLEELEMAWRLDRGGAEGGASRIEQRYDSRRDPAKSPYAAALGQRWSWRIDGGSGVVSEVEGVAAVQSAIYARVEDTRSRWRYRVPLLSGAESWGRALNALLAVCGGAPEATSWESKRASPDLLALGGGQPASQGLEPIRPPVVQVQVELEGVSSARTLQWSGGAERTLPPVSWVPPEGDTPYRVEDSAWRRSSGSLDFTAGELQRGLASESWSTSRVFSLRGRSQEVRVRSSGSVSLERLP